MSSPAPQAASAAAPAKSGKKTPMILGATLLILGAGGYVGYTRFARQKEHAETPEKPRVQLESGVVQLEPFILNLADPAGDRYFRLRMSVVLDQKLISNRMASGLAEVKLRDRILSVLSRKRAPEVVTVEGKERLRDELRATIEALLVEPPFHDEKTDPAPAHVLEVFFKEFLVQ